MTGVEGRVVVAVETSGPVGSVAVARGGEVLARTFLDEESGHAARVVPAVEDVLGRAGLGRGDLDAVVVGAGPGSFTGVRVAAATGKGLAHALEVPLWAVSSLEAAALAEVVLPSGVGPWAASDGGFPGEEPAAGPPVRYVLFDARGERVYAACYRIGPRELETLLPPRATRIGEVLAGSRPDGARFAGSGATRHRDALGRAGGVVLPPPAGVPTADGLVGALVRASGRGPLEDPWRWEPDYLRMAGAERAGAR